MKFGLPTLTPAQINVALTPEIGAETHRVYYSAEQMYHMGKIEVTGDGTAFNYTSNGISIAADPRDLHLRVDKAQRGAEAGDVKVQLNVIYADDAVGVMSATFSIPAWADNQENIFGADWAVDFKNDLPADDGKLVKEITSVNAVTNCLAGNRFSIFASPPVEAYYQIGCVKSKGSSGTTAKAISIACGYQTTAYTKRGMTPEKTLNLSWTYFSSRASLDRVDGLTVDIWMKTVKDDDVHFENTVYTGHQVSVATPRADMEDAVLSTSDGLYENRLIFVAL